MDNILYTKRARVMSSEGVMAVVTAQMDQQIAKKKSKPPQPKVRAITKQKIK